jgi:diguanylate cyclase (GGDEF)-like protein
MMPKMDGLELCRAVRESQHITYTYFILLTALADRESVLKGLEAGADDYLVKPLDRQELQARLISARRVTQLHKELWRLNRELFEETRRDPLTRMGNRRRMKEDLEILVNRASRYQQGFCLAICDIDFFKRYNDTCGHHGGDAALRAVAEALAAHSRAGDAVYRYGGEEFVVVLPEQTLETSLVAMERRRAMIEDLAIPHPGKSPPGVVTVSAGVAAYRTYDGKDHDAVIARADAALYLAKAQGRNRVVAERADPAADSTAA